MGEAEERAKEARKSADRSRIRGQIRSVRSSISTLESQRSQLEKKILRYSNALKEMTSAKTDFDNGKSEIGSQQIESSSWKGTKATKATQELGELKVTVQVISQKISSAIDTIESEKERAERELADVENQLASQNQRVSNLITALNSI